MRMKTVKRAPPLPANLFAGYPKAPTPTQVNDALRSAKPLWHGLLAELSAEFPSTKAEWGTSAPKRGWSLRVKQGDRVVAYLNAVEGGFHACFLLGDKALQAALASDLPAPVVKLIRNSSKCAVGTGVRFEVQAPEDIEVMKKLVQAKLKG
jgi:hypothetical protein